jgi:hypothetical protein
MKYVRIGLELSESFVGLLRSNMTIRGATPGKETHELSVLEILGLVVMGEAMGAHVLETHSRIPQKWRSEIDIIPSVREVVKR